MIISSSLADIVLSVIYDLVVWFFDAVIHTFFREVRSRGTFNIPKKGAVIFVCAPHHNLFVDPVVVMTTSRKESGRRISLLTAAKTYRTWNVGTIARLCSALPVERAQDLVKPYEGTIKVENFGPENDNLVVLGEGTKFTQTAQVKGLIGLHDFLGNAKIKSIESDTKIVLQNPFQVKFDNPSKKDKRILDALQHGYPYVLAPHIDNQKTFQSVFNHLLKGRALGIFPEGGSHDRPTLLPLKPGVALMALGAVAQSEDPYATVSIVPVGLNYFHADRFRSSVVIEYGKPVTVTKKESAEYEKDSRKIVNEFLETIALRLEEVTVTCKDIDTLITIQAARRLYAPTDREATPLPLKVEMNRRLIKGYEKYADQPDVQDMKNSVAKYNKKLMQLGLRDHQVESLAGLNRFSVLITFANRVTRCLVSLCLSLPGLFMFSPVFIVASRISKQKAKAALASSVVKIKGDDVIASWKILVALGLAPMLYVFWAIIATHYVMKNGWAGQTSSWVVFVLCYLLNILITYSSLRTGEIGYEYFTSLYPLAYSLLSKQNDISQIEELKRERRQLSLQVTEFCERYGPSMFDDYTKFYRKYTHSYDGSDHDYSSKNEPSSADEKSTLPPVPLWNFADVPIFSQIADAHDDTESDDSDKEVSIAVNSASALDDQRLSGSFVESNKDKSHLRSRRTN
ncbi:hypothetical protein JCM33374_g604 [Metschnikowia sp. JCM 33374]|nr:hypothetical protein JCM33374_g604 [Metschnikowia sp. JCM 33374]